RAGQERTPPGFLTFFVHVSWGNDAVSLGMRRLRSTDDCEFAAAGAAAEERVPTVRLESRYGDAGRHVELLQNFAAPRIDPTQFAFLVFQGAVPEFAVHPGDAGHEAI